MQVLDRAARARLAAQQRRKLRALGRIEDRALGDQLLDDQALLGLLQLGDRRTLGFDAQRVDRLGEERFDEGVAVTLQADGGRLELLQEGRFDRLPTRALRLVERFERIVEEFCVKFEQPATPAMARIIAR